MNSLKAIIILILLISLNSYSQRLLKKGDKLYAEKDYLPALKNYQKQYKKDSANTTLLRIANTYCHLQRLNDAYNCYAKIPDTALNETSKIKYATVLQQSGKYQKAIDLISSFTNNSDAKRIVSSCKWAIKNSNKPHVFSVKKTNLNTWGQSFGIQFFRNGVIYSSRHNSENYNKDLRGYQFITLMYSEFRRKSFSEPVIFADEFNSKYHVGSATFNSKFNKIVFSKIIKLRGGGDVIKLYIATLKNEKWINIKEFPFNSNKFSCTHPALSQDGNTLYFVSDMPGGKGGKDIYVSKLENNVWSKPENLGHYINTPGDEMFPYVNKKGRLFFSSNGHKGFGGLDIFSAKNKGFKWKVENVGIPLNSSKDDFGFTINPRNTREGLISSNRDSQGDRDSIYYFTYAVKSFKGVVREKYTKQIVDSTVVKLINHDTGEELANVVSKKGKFKLPISYDIRTSNKKYIIQFLPDSNHIAYADTLSGKQISKKLKKNQSYYLTRYTYTLKGRAWDTRRTRFATGAKVNYHSADSAYIGVVDSVGEFQIKIPYMYIENEEHKITASGKLYEDKESKYSRKKIVSFLENPKSFKLYLDMAFFCFKATALDSMVYEPVPNMKVSLRHFKTKKLIKFTKTDKNGVFEIFVSKKLLKQNPKYIVTLSMKGFYNIKRVTLSTEDIRALQSETNEIKVVPIPQFFKIKAIDSLSGRPAPKVVASIYKLPEGINIGQEMSNKKGLIKIPISLINIVDTAQYEVHFKSYFYFPKVVKLPISKLRDTKIFHKYKLEPMYIGKSRTILDSTVSFKGLVQNAITFEPISNAEVSIRKTSKNINFAASKTTPDGHYNLSFSIDLLKDSATNYQTKFSCRGYIPQSIKKTKQEMLDLYAGKSDFFRVFFIPSLKKGDHFRCRNFIFNDKGTLTSRNRKLLDVVASILTDDKDIKIELGIYTDARMSRSKNRKITNKVAKNCYQYLISKGVLPNQILSYGNGDKYILNRCVRGTKCSQAEHYFNRRMEIHVTEDGRR